jgi:hypothetical protein
VSLSLSPRVSDSAPLYLWLGDPYLGPCAPVSSIRSPRISGLETRISDFEPPRSHLESRISDLDRPAHGLERVVEEGGPASLRLGEEVPQCGGRVGLAVGLPGVEPLAQHDH